MSALPQETGRTLGVRMLQIAAIYLVLGMFAGMIMGATHKFEFSPVHAHMNLLGWATLAIAALVYQVHPELSRHWMALAHAWLHNIGLALMMIGLTLVIAGKDAFLPMVMAGALTATLGVLLFAANLCARLSARA